MIDPYSLKSRQELAARGGPPSGTGWVINLIPQKIVQQKQSFAYNGIIYYNTYSGWENYSQDKKYLHFPGRDF